MDDLLYLALGAALFGYTLMSKKAAA